MPRESWKRTSAETATIPVSHAQTGTARAQANGSAKLRGAVVSAGKPGLPEAHGELRRVRVVGADPHLGGGGRDLAQERLLHRRAAGRLLDRDGVEVGDVLDVVIGTGQTQRGA